MQRLKITFRDNQERIYKNVHSFQNTTKDQGLIKFSDGSEEQVRGVANFEFCKAAAVFHFEDERQERYSDINKIIRLPYGFFQIIFNNNEIHYLSMQQIKKIEADPEITVIDIEHTINEPPPFPHTPE